MEPLAKWIHDLPVLPEGECSYFQDRISRMKAFYLNQALSGEYLDYILNEGFRRSGHLFYQNKCPACTQCHSVRIRPNLFYPGKNFRKILKYNSDLRVEIDIPRLTDPKKEIYLKYQQNRHTENHDDVEQLFHTMQTQMYTNPGMSLEWNIYQGDRLIAFAVMDIGSDSVSAVYSVFDTDFPKRSLGTFFILHSLLWAKEKNISFYHLGFFIPGHPKMTYKARFQPAEIRDPATGNWLDSEKFFKENSKL